VGDKIEKTWMGRSCSTFEGGERRVQGLVGKPEEKTPLGKPRLRGKDNNKMDLQEFVCGV